MSQRIVTIHLPNEKNKRKSVRLTPAISALVNTIEEHFDKPELRLGEGELRVYVADWKGVI